MIAVNDPILEPLIRAGDEAERDREIERLVLGTAGPIVQRVLSRYRGPGASLPPQELDDVASTVNLRLVARLRQVGSGGGEAIESFESYVATVAYNVIHDLLRRRFPERTRLKHQLRYVLTHDRRLALWTTTAGPTGGLVSWRERDDVADEAEPRVTPTMRDRERPGDAVVDLFRAVGRPLSLDRLVGVASELWEVRDFPAALPEEVFDASALAQYESRELIEALWSEILLLRPLQRKALLLNLRERSTVNVVSLFLLRGIATFDELAKAMDISPEALAGLWNALPLDDLRIAEMLGISRQQVINLRRAARERLARRLAGGNKGRKETS